MGGKKRAAVMTPEQRSESARKAVQARWSKLSAEQRSEFGRLRVMARWNRKNRGETQDDYARATPFRFEAESSESFGSPRSLMKLGAIAKNASDLSLKYSTLPAHDRLGRAQLLSEFRSEVAKFFKQRARLIELKLLPLRGLHSS